jgi:type I restriction enzyme S subunit
MRLEMIEQLTTMSKYDAYKDSGVEWLGEIPKQWKIKRLKYLLSEVNERSETGQEELLSLSKYNGVIRKSSLEEKSGQAISLVGYKKVANGQLVINKMQAVNGLLAISNLDGITSPDYSVYKEKNNAQLNIHYLNYLLNQPELLAEFKKRVRGVMEGFIRLYTNDLYDIKVILPPLSEQSIIVTFLDRKTVQIDQAVAIKEKQIALLKERKQILIQNAVTRGLDPNVPMRDSGVEWIGKIPAHWNVKRLRLIGNTQNGISAGADYFGSGYPFVSYGDVYNNRELPVTVKGLAKSSDEDRKQYSIEKGDVLFTRTSETIEEIGFASVCMETILNSTFAGFLIRFRPKAKELFEGFSKYYFNAPMLRLYFVKEMNLVTRASLSQELLKNLPVLLPPFDEQKSIYFYIETESAKIDRAISLQQQQIDKLKEYKATLINSAVTGKISVSELVEGSVPELADTLVA